MQFKLPELGEGVHEGELIKWKVKPGDAVNYDQALCEIMTDKATIEIPSAFKGKVSQLDAKEGEVVKVGQVMCTFEGAATSTASADAAAKIAPKTATDAAPKTALAPTASPQASAQPQPSLSAKPATNGGSAGLAVGAGTSTNVDPATRVLSAPSTRKLAREMGVDLNRISGSGPHGRVMKEDLSNGATTGTGAVSAKGGFIAPASGMYQTRPAGAQTEERIAFRGLRKKIAEKMRQSKDHAAHFTYVEEADATQLVALRARAKEMGAAQGIKVTYLPFLFKMMVAALKKYPILNSSLDEEKQEIVLKHYFNIALSVQTDDGLTAPVIKDVGSKSVLQIAHEIQQVVERARTKKLTMDDLTGGTITLTNAGTIGGLFATPVINYPEVAILGFNKIFRKPVAIVEGGTEKIVVRDWTYFSLSLDHRIVDGAIGAEFMKLFISYVENPSLLLMDM